MNFTRPQLIILGSVGAILAFILLLATGIIPGLRERREKPPEITLTIWGAENESFLFENFTGYEALRENAAVNYEELNPATYEKEVIDALATGKGPDIIMFHSSWLPKHFNKIVPLKEDQLTLKTLKEIFPEVVEQNFAPDGKIYALPLYIDTLALFYNQDIFDRNGIAVPPKDWLDFQNLVPRLRKTDSAGKLTKAAAAIGGSNDTVYRGSDLLMLLMLQAGAKMTDENFTRAAFSDNVESLFPGIDALNFYTKFSDPKNTYYTWNENMEYSLDSFSKGDTAMIFGYASDRQLVKSKNPFLNFKAAEMPQPKAGEKSVNYADYWGLAVTGNSQNPDWAWDLILYLTANETAAEHYFKTANRPPALRSLIQKNVDHPELGVFTKQGLSARSWPQIDKDQIADVFSRAIKSVVSGRLDASNSLNQAQREVTELMRARR